MSKSPSFPPSGQYLKTIRQSARKLCEKAQVTIKDDAIEHLLVSSAFKETFDQLSSFPGLALPLKFASHLDELNVLSILGLLQFGTAFEIPLRAQTGRGAGDAIKALIFAMYITSNGDEGDLLSSNGISTIALAKVAELLGVDVMIEKPHETLVGVTVGALGGPLYTFVQLVTRALNETGAALLASGYPNLGLFVVEALKEGQRQTTQSDSPNSFVDFTLDKIVRAIPGFRDMYTVDGEPAYIFSKALFLLNAIFTRFGSISPPPFPVPSTSDLPAFADGLLPPLLVQLGVIDLSNSQLNDLWPAVDSPAKLVKNGGDKTERQVLREGPAVTQDQAYLLRAASIVAVDSFPRIASKLSSKNVPTFTVPQINSWLSSIAKSRETYHLKELSTMVFKDTVHW
ncbi:hypothetical protein FA15DRAFT_617507 [Coprinopsis marcescibilis]|uniref:Queuosine 5'-phosphate N-glycosylase/hydrolase n=1 Tax=Coprinopsis marcescibilis TaxID=230819 RepID=A0A5C3KY56_COPMA|nr:hypothetical protein FA15DRAFT_617507 [Coprinopsis marcescibilis]